MPKIDNKLFYTSAISKHGTTAKGVNWASEKNQKLRFKILLEMLPKDLSKSTLSDIGCGFGDFYTYMDKKKNLPKEYIGVDSLSDMYEIATNNTGCKILLADATKDKLPSSDYSICSGAMNTLTHFETHQFIYNAYLTCKKGFIFNILHGEEKSKTYNYTTTKQIKQIAKDLHVKDVVFKTGYLDNDITVGFFK
jgi:SAM-dependent methyltransferase